jgi:hypothetical protein
MDRKIMLEQTLLSIQCSRDSLFEVSKQPDPKKEAIVALTNDIQSLLNKLERIS